MDSAWSAPDLIVSEDHHFVAKNLQNLTMKSPTAPRRLPWLEREDAFPPVAQAWGELDPAPGLLAAGADLSLERLIAAYSQGIFPWYSAGQPVLWWSPEPRMVMRLEDFKLHRSLRKSLANFLATPNCEIRINHDFSVVIAACASAPRQGQASTWIVPEMQAAYTALHHAGHAHSIEVWRNEQLIGGLYCTTLGRAVFGESMFASATDASKIALCALVAICRSQGVEIIDCQQNTAHLASLGAREMPREEFCAAVGVAALENLLTWPAKLIAQSVEWNLLDARLTSPFDL
jgi:leucyl/phenylalanyl-tRNA---protein transferase